MWKLKGYNNFPLQKVIIQEYLYLFINPFFQDHVEKIRYRTRGYGECLPTKQNKNVNKRQKPGLTYPNKN
jgi:hypothetical protein